MKGSLPRPEGEGWEPCEGGWKRPCTPAELARLADHAKVHRTEWVEKCEGCDELRDVVECLKCRDNCVVCDTNDHDRPEYCTGGGCADDWKGATKDQRLQVQHCNDCCSCVDLWKLRDSGGLVVLPNTDGLLGRIGELDAYRQVAQLLPVDGDPSAEDLILRVSFLDIKLHSPASPAELEAAGQIRLLDPEVT